MNATFLTINDIVNRVGRGPDGNYVVFLRDYNYRRTSSMARPLVKVDETFFQAVSNNLGPDGDEMALYLQGVLSRMTPGDTLYIVPVWERCD
jgi:hypothetical protein